MSALAFEPHHDDVALFAAFEAQRLQAHVVTVLESHVQAARGLPITQQMRAAENDCAMRELGLEWTQWTYRDDGPAWDQVLVAMRLIDERLQPEWVLAPAVEEGGHDHHNEAGKLAREVFGTRVVAYLTYTRHSGRSRAGTPVVPTREQIGRKHRALACFRSQIAEPSTASWFVGDLAEYVA